MNLAVLIGLIVGGLLTVDIILRFVGNKGGGRLVSETDAVEQLRRDYPEIEPTSVGRIVITRDRGTAFLAMAEGMTGFVHGIGDRFVTRQLSSADIAELGREGADVLTVRFKDVTLRHRRFAFASRDERDFAADALAPG